MKEKVQYRYKVSRQCECGSKSDRACLGLECVYCILIVCVLIVLAPVQAFLGLLDMCRQMLSWY
jgi:hypothetical protein